MNRKNFEKELPENYRQVFHLSATNKKIGIIMNLAALAIAAIVVFLAYLPVWGESFFQYCSGGRIGRLIWILVLLAYIVLHELVHGAAYKAMTGEKLTFGMQWSCAFCGVPHVYTYRRTALISLVSPLILFSAVFLGVSLFAFWFFPEYYMYCVFLFALHLGGCCGDIYMMLLLLFKYKSPALLLRDTGPEQFLYLPREEEN